MKYFIHLFVSFVVFIVFMAVGLVLPQTVSAHHGPAATVNLDPNPPANSIPQNLEHYLSTCDQVSPVQTPGFVQWVSPSDPNQWAQGSKTVAEGTTTINLTYHFAAAFCIDGAADETRTKLYSGSVSPSGSVNNINGQVGQLVYNSGTTPKGKYYVLRHNFSITHPTGFTEGDYTIQLSTVSMNRFNSNHYCNINGAYQAGGFTYDNCPRDTPTFNFRINVETSGEVSISADCRTLDYTARTTSGQPYDVTLWVDGVSTGRKQSGRPSGSSGSFDISDWDDGNAHEYSVLVEDTSNSDAAFSNTVRNTNCITGAPTCNLSATSSSISWNTTDATSGTINNGVGAMTPIASGSKPIAPPVGTTTYTATVNGPGGSGTCQDTVTVVASFCPNPTGPSFDQYQTISLSNGPVPHPRGGPPWYGSWGRSQTRYEPKNEYRINYMRDQYGQYADSADWSPNGRSPNPFTLNYENFQDYPYDSHNVTVGYTTWYDQVRYRATGSAVYGWRYTGDADGDGVRDWPDEYETYIIGYRYQEVSRWERSTNGVQSAPTMPECYHRRYETTPTFNNVTWDDIEEVTALRIGSTARTDFMPDSRAPSNLLRNSNMVRNEQVQIEITLYHSDGRPPEPYYTNAAYNAGGCNNDFSGGSFTAFGTTNFSTDAINNSVDCRRATIPPLSAGDYACVTLTFPQTRGIVNQSGVIQSSSTSVTVPTPAGTNAGDPGCTQRLVNRPYITVSGGDVIAGSGFANPDGSCPVPLFASIRGWNRGNAPNSTIYPNTRFGGSGTTLATYAMAAIDRFISAAGRNNPGPLDGLSFANTTGAYGGGWDTSNYTCMPNYLAEQTGAALPTTNISGLDGSFTAGDTNITTSNVGNGQRIAIFSSGTVNITGNIRVSRGGYNSIDDVPAVRIIAREIFIHPNVTEIDATLIAQGGEIYTCSNGSGNAGTVAAPPDGSIANGACRNNGLTVRGGLVADKVYFLRSRSSVRRSNVGTDYSFLGTDPDVAEHIIYTPMMWLTNFDTAIQEDAPYDAFTNMPPVL